MGNKLWGLFCYKCAAGSSTIAVLFLEVLLDVLYLIYLMACSLNLFVLCILLL